MTFPNDAGIDALRGKRCLDSQYFLGHSSNLFHEDGDDWCCEDISTTISPRLTIRCYARGVIRINTTGYYYLAMTSQPEIQFDSEIDITGALVVNCFPSLGFVSSIVAHYLVDKLNLKLVGGVRHPALLAVCLVQEGMPLPPLRFYAGEPICNMEECNKVVLIASEIQVPAEMCLPLSGALIDWIKQSNASATIMIDAYSPGVENKHTVFDEDDSDGSLLGIGSIEESHKMLNELKIPLLKQGIIGGMTGVMMGESRRRSVNSIAMLAEASGEFGNGTIPDSRAAARIINCLDKLLPAIYLDSEPLMVEAQRIEEQIREMMASQLNPSAEQATNEASNMYG